MPKFTLKNKIISIVLLILLLSIGVILSIPKKVLPASSTSSIALPSSPVSAPQIITTLEIENTKYTDEIPAGTNVYDFMKKLQIEGKINFTEEYYLGMGELITSINGIKNSGDKSWIYYVNGKEASVGVSNYKIIPGNIVTWKYEGGKF